MTGRRTSALHSLAMGGAAAATTWLATLAWLGFTEAPGRYLRPLLLIGLVVALSGAGLRAARLPRGVVLLGQVVASGMVVSQLLTGSPFPVGSAFIELLTRIGAAVETAQRYEAPVPPEAPIATVLVLGGWVCMVIVDACASTWRRVPLAGLPLLTIYSIPVSILGGGVAWWAFALTAGGFLLMLYLQHSDAISRWGRPLDTPGSRYGGRAGTIRAGAGSVGATATVLAVVAPVLVPTVSLALLGVGPGDGPGDGITVENPITDLRRDLLRGEDLPLLRITTDDPTPSYLRIAALNNFSENEWTTGDRDIPPEQRAWGRLPLPGVDRSVPRREYDYGVTALSGFHGRWLPTQYPTSRIAAQGDWRYDTATMDFLGDEDLDIAGLSYSFTGVDLALEARRLAASPSSAGEVDSSFRDLPDDFPTMVGNLAVEITRDYPSRYEKAVALQEWFREDGGFSYSLDNVQSGNGPDRLVEFLTEGTGRTGYCEQFASAMAAMARSLGIPARVAVGFLEPERVGRGTYEYSSYDMHAWPELYFTGAGWIRFEPTPPDRASGVPPYTTQQLPQAPEVDPSGGPSSTANPNVDPSTGQQLDEGAIAEDQAAARDQRSAWVPWVTGTSAVLLVVLLLLLPRLLRRQQAASRLSGAPELAWAELEATAVDLGVPWPSQRSPRQTRHHLVDHLGEPVSPRTPERPPHGADVSPEGVAALDRLVRDLELLRYARPGSGVFDRDGGVTQDARTVVAALHGGADTKARRRARWWPASVLPWRRTSGTAVQTPVLVSHGGIVDHVG